MGIMARFLSRLRRASDAESGAHRPVKLLPIGVALTLTLLAAGGLAAALLGAALAWLGPPQVSAGKLSLRTLLDIIKIALAVVGGIGGAVALVVAYRKQRLAEEDNYRAREANERDRQAARREDIKLYVERFTTAAGQLGNESAAVRLAGVHALAALADDWEGGRQMCIDVLCAYLRMPPAPEPDAQADPAAHTAWLAMGEVRATIWRLIAAHLKADAPIPWHGADLDFTGVTITTDLDFTNAVFSGTIRFTGAMFAGSRVDFRNAEFTGAIYFSGARFTGDKVYFDDARFTGGRVDFYGAAFARGRVGFVSAKFTGGEVCFVDAEFTGGRVDFRWAEFADGDVDFIGARFTGGEVGFVGARFVGGRVDFSAVSDWSHPPLGLPSDAPGLVLPALGQGGS